MIAEAKKTCRKCGEEKPLGDYYQERNRNGNPIGAE